MVARSPKAESRRSSKAWDSSRYPRCGILKKTQPVHNHNTVVKRAKEPTESLSTNLSDMMSSLTLVAHSKPISTKAKKLYQSFAFEDSYDESTVLTVKFCLTKERLEALEASKYQLTFADIFDIPEIISIVLDKAKDDCCGLYNTFFCDAYWLIKYIDAIIHQVFNKFNVSEEQVIFYNPTRNSFDDTRESRLEQTNIIKDHVSYCDWVATTVGPNYKQRNVPEEIKDLFISMITKLNTLLTSENGCGSWINYACDLF